MKVHRWQPSGKTPCGRNIADVQTNIGYYLSDGVTCESCHKATTFLSIMGDDWNGQSYGYLPGAARDLWEADLDGNCPSKSELGRHEELLVTKDEMRALQPGDIIQHKGLRIGYIVAANYGTRITAVQTADVTNPSEWDVIYQRRLTPLPPDARGGRSG